MDVPSTTIPELGRLMDALADVARAAHPPLAIDRPVYEEAGLDPFTPILLGSGALDARVGFMGRDPGRTEVLRGEPFIGAGGRKVRDALHRAAFHTDAADEHAALRVGRAVFWANTVPYKPVGNKAWSVPVQRRFAPAMAALVLEAWTGADLITLGNAAFSWVALVEPGLTPTLASFWARPDRYEATLALEVHGRPLRLHPLPHPSPLNATWFKRFPSLLDARLRALGWPNATERALLHG